MGGREGVHGTSACSPLSTCPSFLPVVSRPIHSAIFSANFGDARARGRWSINLPPPARHEGAQGVRLLGRDTAEWFAAVLAGGHVGRRRPILLVRRRRDARPPSAPATQHCPTAPRAQEHAEQGSNLRQTAATARGVVRGKRSADLSPLLLQLLDARDAAVPYAAQWHVLPAAEGCGSSGAATGRATGRVSIGQQAARRPWPLERGRGCERRASAAADAGGPDAREQGPEAPTARLNLAAACGRRRAGWATACGRAH